MTNLEMISVTSCPTCGALAQVIAGEPVYRHVPPYDEQAEINERRIAIARREVVNALRDTEREPPSTFRNRVLPMLRRAASTLGEPSRTAP